MLTTVLTTQRFTTLCSGGGREQEGWARVIVFGRENRIYGINIVLPTTPTGPRRGLWRFGTTNIKYERHRMFT